MSYLAHLFVWGVVVGVNFYDCGVCALKISVVITTARLGSMDMLAYSFKHQTMPMSEWEIILVDLWYEERKELLKVQLPNLPLRHTAAPNSEVYDNASGFNAGLVLATGELVIFLVDYVWLPPNFLARHWEVYSKCSGFSLTVFVDRYVPPPIKTSGSLLWSVFEPEFDYHTAEYFFNAYSPGYKERKGGIVGACVGDGLYEMPPQLVYMLGDALPLKVLQDLNGWCRAYDGGYGWNDIDLTIRASMLGWRFAVDPLMIIQKLGISDIAEAVSIPIKRRLRVRTPDDNKVIFEHRMDEIRRGVRTIKNSINEGAW